MFYWLLFLICTSVILFSGIKLSYYGDILAEKTGMGGTWIGIVLMASVTSLPELITGISSVALYNLPNLAAGGILGSCAFNLLILALIDFLGGDQPISTRVHQGHILSAGFGILLLGMMGFALMMPGPMPQIAWVGLDSIFYISIYLIAMKLIFQLEKRRMAEMAHEKADQLQYQKISTAKAYTFYFLNAGLIVVAGCFLPEAGDAIAKQTGLGETFVGSLLIAFSTSLPEVVVAVSAVKIGAFDMAFGNLLGSNLFNMAILSIEDVFYTAGSLTQSIESSHMIMTVSAIVMTGLAIIGLTYRAAKKPFLIAWDAYGLIAVYLLTTYLLFISV